jgi:septum formation protein
MFLAKAKASSVSLLNRKSFFIAADQVCELDGEIFDKPLTEENAIKHLKKLRSKTHTQNCATVIYHNSECIWEFSGKALLTMRNLQDKEIESYVKLEKPLNSAGSYMFEKHGKHLFSDVQGDHDVILGLPIVKLVDKLYELGLIRLN